MENDCYNDSWNTKAEEDEHPQAIVCDSLSFSLIKLSLDEKLPAMLLVLIQQAQIAAKTRAYHARLGPSTKVIVLRDAVYIIFKHF